MSSPKDDQDQALGRGRARGRGLLPPPSNVGSLLHGGRGRSGVAPSTPAPVPVPTPRPQQQQQQQQHRSSSSNSSNDPHSPGRGRGREGNGDERKVEGSVRGTARTFTADEMLLTRPEHIDTNTKKGKFGEQISLMANYYEVILKNEFLMYQHHVTFTPLIDLTTLKKRLLREHQEIIGPYIFDGHMLFTPGRLSSLYENTPLVCQHPITNERIELTIILTKEMRSNDPACIQFYNIVIRKCMGALKLQLIQRQYFNNRDTIKLPQQNLELWPGFSTSIRHHENSLLFCIEATHKVLRQETAFNIMDYIRQSGGSGIKERISEEIIGRYVMTQYNRRIYRVDDIKWETRPINTFEREGKGPISYNDYYQQVYNLQIRNANTPLLLSRRSKRDIRRGLTNDILLVPEFCQMTGLTDAMRANFNLMKVLNDHLQMIPIKRVNRIGELMNKMINNDVIHKELTDWNIVFSQDLVKVQGRKLPQDLIEFGINERDGKVGTEQVSANKADWNQGFRNNKLHTIIPLKNWVIITPKKDRTQLDAFLGLVRKVAGPLGFFLGKPDIIELQKANPSPSDYSAEIKQYVGIKRGDIEMFMILLPNNQLHNYACVKSLCCIDFGIPSQCIVVKTLSNKGLMSIATKVVIQMSAKLGGVPWSINMPPLKGLMVMGYDVYHGPTKQGRKTSWGALVASISPSYGKFHSKVAKHEQGVEITNSLDAHIRSLEAYNTANGAYPQRIAFYRDGVGEGQLEHVFNIELAGIKKTIQDVYAGNEIPKFLFVVVTKKIRTKFFRPVPGPGRTQSYENPLFGTVVDDVVTIPNRYDFFLVSQIARQGTVSPTSYNIISDTFGLDADKIQRLTYKMCHLYYNWSGTVSVPAVCQYAHKLAFLTGTALDAESHDKLSNLLFYL